MANTASRRLLVEFDRLVRNTSPELEFDPTIITDVIYMFLTMAQEKVISDTFLQSPELLQNIQAIKKRSDILRNIIKRGTVSSSSYDGKIADGGREYTIDFDDYWIFLNGTVYCTAFSALSSDTGGSQTIVNMELITHEEVANVISDIYDEPFIENIPILLEDSNRIILYLDKEKSDAFSNIVTTLQITYLAHPDEITDDVGPSLPEAMYKDIVRIAVDDFIINYKYKLKGNESNR